MPPKLDTSTSWTPEHQLSVVRHIVSAALSTRPALYAQPGMADVNGNGGSRINQKLQATLALLTKQFPGAEGVIKEEVARVSGRGKERAKRKSEEQGGGAVKKERSS